MLVLDRKAGQIVVIGDTRLKVLEIRPSGKVVLGVEAPVEIPIRREELEVELRVMDDTDSEAVA